MNRIPQVVREPLIFELVGVSFVQPDEAFNALHVEVNGKVIATLDEEQLHELYFRLGMFLTHVNQVNAGWKSTIYPNNVEVQNDRTPGGNRPSLFQLD